MATATITGFQCGNGNWNYYSSSYTRGNSHYVDYTSYSVKTRGKITVAPDSGKKITGITLTVGVVRSGATNLYCYLLSSEPTSLTTAPSSYLARARYPSSGTSNPTASGAMWSFSLTGLSITSSTTLYLWFCTVDDISGAYTQIWDKVSGAVTSQAYLTLTQAAMTASISYNGNGYTGGTLPSSGSYNIGSSYTVSSNTLTHSDTNGYVISFNSNGGGTAPSSITQKIGWTHDYWTLNSTSGTRYNKGASYTVPSSATTFYAHWSTSRKAITLPAAPSAPTGKYFTGWYTASSGGTKVGNASASWTPDATRTLYAQWAWNTYTVSYNGNGYTGGTLPGNQTKTYGTNLTLSSNNLTKSNTSLTGFTVTFNKNGGNNPSVASVTNTRSTSYSHNGWRLNSTSGTLYSKGGTYSTNAAATFYASWSTTTNNGAVTTATCTRGSTSSSCTVSFNATTNGGSCSTSSLTSSRTTTYTCTGWWTATSGGTKRCNSGGSYTPTASETVYAQWSSSTGAYSAITLPTATKTGYTFVGWSTSSTATSGTTGSYTPTGNVTLYAIFSQNTYTLTVGKNGVYQGSGTSNETFALAYNATKDFQDGGTQSKGWGGWYWRGSYTWKNFGTTTYCATVWSDGNRRTGAFNKVTYQELQSYNNAGTSTRPCTVTYPADSNSGTSYVFQAAYSASSSTSAYGFMGPRLNGTGLNNTRWIHVFRAKLPSNLYWWPTNNSMGSSDAEIHWLTTNQGTGGWYDYAYERRFGATGSPSTTAFAFVSMSTSNSSHTVPTTAVTIQVAYSILFQGAEEARNRTLTMANTDMGVSAQRYQYEFWSAWELNGGTFASTPATYHNYGTAYSIPAPTKTNYAFSNWTRIYATNIFKKSWRYVNNVSGNTFNTFKIQIEDYSGGNNTLIANSDATTVNGTWTCTKSTGWYWCYYGMNGNTADKKLLDRIYLENNALYGYHWERVNNTAGQDITIKNLVFGRQDSTTTVDYPSSSNYTLYLSANWIARTKVYINANGGWLNHQGGYGSTFRNNTTPPLDRVIRTDSPWDGGAYYYQITYGQTSDLPDWNNPNYLNLIRFGYSVPTGHEYYNAAGTLFEHNTLYAAQTFTPSLTSTTPIDGEVWVNWQANDYTFTLQRQNDSLPSAITENYGQIAQLPEDSKEYYTFMGWFKDCRYENDYVQLGRDYLWNDKFTAHLTVYKEDWSTTDSSTRLITCASSGGWSITQNADDNCVQANVYKDGAWIRAKSNITLQSLTSGFHDFDIVFTGSEVQLYIDDVLVASNSASAPIAYRVTSTTTTQLVVGKGATTMSSSNPRGIVSTALPLGGYIGNVVIKHQNIKIDSAEARTQWNTPVENITLQSFFREDPYVQIHLNIGNGVVIDSNNNIYHNGDVIKFYYEDNPQRTFTCYPPTAQMITSFTSQNDLTNIITRITTTGIPVTTPYSNGELAISYTAIGSDNSYVDIYLSMTYTDIPVLRYQYLLVDNEGNYMINDNGNNIKVALKYIPYRHNGSTWQRCEPRGYSNGWKLGG